MSEQQPTRFENYPPDAAPTFSAADPTPPPPLAAYSPPPAGPPRHHSRRGLLGGLVAIAVGVPVVVAVPRWFASTGPSSDTSEAPSSSEPDPEATEFTVGDYSGTVPSGWRLTVSEDRRAVLARGANQVTLVCSTPKSEKPSPVDDIAAAVRTAGTGFTGSLDAPVNESTGSRAVATLAGKGTFMDKPARQFAELWLDDDGAYLLIVTALTAAEGSAIARQATEIAWSLTAGMR